jgi:aminoglycoside phosphotransferase (APT) family kinase protein
LGAAAADPLRYTETVNSLDGLDLGALDRHLRAVGIPRTGELNAELIPGGRSNLTFLIYDDVSRWVLRRPPLHGLTPSAHDMAREYRVVAALAGRCIRSTLG